METLPNEPKRIRADLGREFIHSKPDFPFAAVIFLGFAETTVVLFYSFHVDVVRIFFPTRLSRRERGNGKQLAPKSKSVWLLVKVEGRLACNRTFSLRIAW